MTAFDRQGATLAVGDTVVFGHVGRQVGEVGVGVITGFGTRYGCQPNDNAVFLRNKATNKLITRYHRQLVKVPA